MSATKISICISIMFCSEHACAVLWRTMHAHACTANCELPVAHLQCLHLLGGGGHGLINCYSIVGSCVCFLAKSLHDIWAAPLMPAALPLFVTLFSLTYFLHAKSWHVLIDALLFCFALSRWFFMSAYNFNMKGTAWPQAIIAKHTCFYTTTQQTLCGATFWLNM